jgi:putative ubiquitin-RnfH superfamily antitoxin RatB of RatAB toxin-antitoxin module
MARTIRVEVVYALPGEEDCVALELPAGMTVREALERSGMAERHPGIDLEAVGIFGKAVAPGATPKDGDRIEIYRPLAIDPKAARRLRAARSRKRRTTGTNP